MMDRIKQLSPHIFLMQHCNLVGAKFGALLVVSRQSCLGPLGTSEIALLRVRVQKKKMILGADVEVAHQCTRGCLWNVVR